MATFTETQVRATIEVRRDRTGVVRVIAIGSSLDDAGMRLRSTEVDITDQLSAARVQGATDLLVDIETRLKTLWGIP